MPFTAKQTLEDNFDFNTILATSLAQVFSLSDRIKINAWKSKLRLLPQERTSEPPEKVLKNRNDYMWYMLLVLQNGRLSTPFSRAPPIGPLRPLSTVLPPQIYEDVLTASTNNYAWITQAAAGEDVEDEEARKPVLPFRFLWEQPRPHDGFICYTVVFSQQD